MDNSKFSVAPMLDWTDRHCRYFHRILTKKALLYSEMITTGAIIHGDRERHLAFDHQENPVALQLGGSDPHDLALCAKIGEDYGYTQINLNCGCPSDRVQKGKFGACLMAEPNLVAQCIQAMQAQVKIPITIKTRIGVDDNDAYQFLLDFVKINASAGCSDFIIHARKAWLSGLSPKENREIPPLNYARVHQLKQDMPSLNISLNGGISNLDEALNQLVHVDGVMLGRKAYHEPYILGDVDNLIFNQTDKTPLTRIEIVTMMLPYLEKHLKNGGKLNHITRHMLGLFHGQHGGRYWRRILSENAWKPDATIKVITQALQQITM